MDLQALLDERGMTKYRLSKASGVPNTTIADICAGRSSIERCSAKTVHQLAGALGCTMEQLMEPGKQDAGYGEDGLPIDKGYLECGLPAYLRESIDLMRSTWERIDRGEKCPHWDGDYCRLQSDINSAEAGGAISSEQAWYLRERYLHMEKPGEIE